MVFCRAARYSFRAVFAFAIIPALFELTVSRAKTHRLNESLASANCPLRFRKSRAALQDTANRGGMVIGGVPLTLSKAVAIGDGAEVTEHVLSSIVWSASKTNFSLRQHLFPASMCYNYVPRCFLKTRKGGVGT